MVLPCCAFFVEKPPADYQPPSAGKQVKRWVNPVAMEAATGTMVRKPAFWLYYLWAILLSAAGLALVSLGAWLAPRPVRHRGPPGRGGHTPQVELLGDDLVHEYWCFLSLA